MDTTGDITIIIEGEREYMNREPDFNRLFQKDLGNVIATYCEDEDTLAVKSEEEEIQIAQALGLAWEIFEEVQRRAYERKKKLGSTYFRISRVTIRPSMAHVHDCGRIFTLNKETYAITPIDTEVRP